MSETFDPDAWPFPHGGSSNASGGPTPPRSPNGSSPSRTAESHTTEDVDAQGGHFVDEYAALNDNKGKTKSDFDDFSHEEPSSATYGDTYGAPPQPPRGPAQDNNYNDFSHDADDDPYGDKDQNRYGADRFEKPANGYDDDNYQDGYDDDYDDDFDRQPSENKGGIVRRILPVLVGLAFILAIIFGAKSFLGGDSKKNPVAEQTPATTAAPTETTISPGAPSSSATAPGKVTEALNQAFAAWGQFAVSGNLDTVRPYFVNDGPQFDRFQIETQTIQANPPGGAPLQMEMINPQASKDNDNSWQLKGLVSVGRTGETPQQFPWEIRLTRGSDRDPWQILSVRQY